MKTRSCPPEVAEQPQRQGVASHAQAPRVEGRQASRIRRKELKGNDNVGHHLVQTGLREGGTTTKERSLRQFLSQRRKETAREHPGLHLETGSGLREANQPEQHDAAVRRSAHLLLARTVPDR